MYDSIMTSNRVNKIISKSMGHIISRNSLSVNNVKTITLFCSIRKYYT